MKKQTLLLVRAVLMLIITFATLTVAVFAWFVSSERVGSGTSNIQVITVNDIVCTFYRSQDNKTYTQTDDPLSFVNDDFIPGKVIYTRIDLTNALSNNVTVGMRSFNTSLKIDGAKLSTAAANDFNNNVKVIYAVRTAASNTPPDITQPVDVYDQTLGTDLVFSDATSQSFINSLNTSTDSDGNAGMFTLCPAEIPVNGNSTTSVYLFYAFDRDFTGLYTDESGVIVRYGSLEIKATTLQLFF